MEFPDEIAFDVSLQNAGTPHGQRAEGVYDILRNIALADAHTVKAKWFERNTPHDPTKQTQFENDG